MAMLSYTYFPTSPLNRIRYFGLSTLAILALVHVCISFLDRSLVQTTFRRRLFERQDIQTPNHDSYRRTTTTTTTTPKLKPIIYTFYHDFNGAEGSGTGMTTESDQALLKVWMDEWIAAGWIPRVLSLEDARQHPHYRTLDTMLNGLPFKMYDRLCFIRWLAMANQPFGGFLTDYDTFPLAWVTSVLPNDGRLTVHEQTESGGVPSLVSASQWEWFRFAWALAENAVVHRHESHWSDMKAMQDVYQQSGKEAYLMTNGVIPGTAVLHGRGYPPETCERAASSFAVHFSHYSVDKGILPEGIVNGPQARAAVATVWLQQWRQHCTVHSTEPQQQPLGEHPHQQQQQSAVRTKESDIDAFSNVATVPEPVLQMNSATAPRDGKPVIFTFCEHVDDPHQTDMIQNNDDDLKSIQAWALSWFEIGWDPRVLDINVARLHSEFDAFDNTLQHLHNMERLRYYRYLAMCVAGGGWLSDFDTYPLSAAVFHGTPEQSLFLPNDGYLTIHDGSDSGGILSIVSGVSSEWFRLAKALVESVLAHQMDSHWSDTQAMQDVFQRSIGSFHTMDDIVVSFTSTLGATVISDDTCVRLQGKFAIHFADSIVGQQDSSTSQLETGATSIKHLAPTLGRHWLQQYRHVCVSYEYTS